MAESYHNSRVLSLEEFSFAFDMLDIYPWITRQRHRRGYDEMLDRLILFPEERALFRDILNKFIYVDSEQCETLIQQIVDQLAEWGCDNRKTVILATRDDPKDNDGSCVFLKMLSDHLFGWDEKRFCNYYDFPRRFSTLKNYDKIVLIDDFIGSGFIMNDRYSLLKSEMGKLKKPRELYVIALAGMKAAKDNYPFLAQGNVFVPLWLEKAIDRDKDVVSTRIMSGILSRLNNRNNDTKRCELSKCGFGFGDMAGAYYNVYFRMPDNMLAIFWWGLFKENREVFHSMFRR